MVISDDFVWLHLGKTGGTTTRQLFKLLNKDIKFHAYDNTIGRHSALTRRNKVYIEQKLGVKNFKTIINFRPLPYWIISHVEFVKLYYKKNYTRKQVLKGYVGNGTSTITADERIMKFNAPNVNYFIRTDFLEYDFIEVMNNFITVSDAKKDLIMHMSRKVVNNNYDRNINSWYSKKELFDLYDNNPIYTDLERKIYGKLAV